MYIPIYTDHVMFEKMYMYIYILYSSLGSRFPRNLEHLIVRGGKLSNTCLANCACTTIQTFTVYIQYGPKKNSNYSAVVRSDRSEFSTA